MNDKEIQRAQEFLDGIVECVYQTGDVAELEHCLEELCDQLGIKFSMGTPMIEKKNENRSYHYHQGYQRALLDLIKKD